MPPRHYSILTLALLTACGPCMPCDFGDTSTIIGEVCPPVGDETTEVAPGSSDGGAPSTDDDSSSDGTTLIDATDSSGAVDETDGTPPIVCDGTAEPGAPWGPCLAEGGCTGDGVFCIASPAGAVCMPACDAGECPAFGCTNGTCRDDGACAPFCGTDSDCPYVGMVCDIGATPAPTCIWLD